MPEYRNERTSDIEKLDPALAGMSDPAKREAATAAAGPNLQAAFTDGGPSDFLTAAAMNDPSVLQDRIVKLRLEQKKAQEIGNQEAADTYQQVIDTLQQRIADIPHKTMLRDNVGPGPAPQTAAKPMGGSTSMPSEQGANNATPGIGR